MLNSPDFTISYTVLASRASDTLMSVSGKMTRTKMMPIVNSAATVRRRGMRWSSLTNRGLNINAKIAPQKTAPKKGSKMVKKASVMATSKSKNAPFSSVADRAVDENFMARPVKE